MSKRALHSRLRRRHPGGDPYRNPDAGTVRGRHAAPPYGDPDASINGHAHTNGSPDA